MLANSVISNPTGFKNRVYFNGAEIELALPISVVAHHQVLNITITNHVYELHVTFIALKEAIPDLQRLAGYTADAAGELAADLARVQRRAARVQAHKSATGLSAPTARRRSPRRGAVR
jgi:hypothetical protein